jgi:HEAT repeat protein
MGGSPDDSPRTDGPAPAPTRTLAEPLARRRRAVVAGHGGDVATARAALDDPDAGVRASAVRALARAGALDGRDLRSAAHDPHPSVRRAAAELLGRQERLTGEAPDEAVVTELLATLLDDADDAVVEVAAWAAGETDAGRGCLDRLVALVADHTDPLVREAAVAALGALGDERGLPAILAATRDRATVRRRAVIALAPFDGADVDEALARAREDRDWQVRQAAEDLS